MSRLRYLVIAVALVGATSTTAFSEASKPAAIATSSPCFSAPTPQYRHVVWIMLENVGYSVVGSPSAPYFNELSNSCGMATNYDAVAHPSLPNYIALTSGSTQGITNDGEPFTHPLKVASIFSELGNNWRSIVESMPVSCDRVTSGEYAARHNPAVYFSNLGASCARNDVALRSPLNLSAAFTLIVPNVCNDMHSCAVSTGDTWLRRMVPAVVASPQYQSRSLALFITFDENDGGATNRVPVVVVAPSVPRGLRSNTALTHYSLLRATESLLHVGLLGNARTAPSLIGPFHL